MIQDLNAFSNSEQELHRLAALHEYAVLGSPAEVEFDEIVLLAAEICKAPIALISLMDETKQWIKAKVGIDCLEIDREFSFCHHTIHSSLMMEVVDTHLDERFVNNPLVVKQPNIRFYAGIPLLSKDGHALGTISVLDTAPRTLSDDQRKFLSIISKNVMTLLELRKKNNQLVDAKELLELVTETNQQYIFAKDSDFRIVLANSSFKSLYPEAQRDKVVGYTTLEDYEQKYIDEFLQQDRIAFRMGSSETLEKIQFPNGETRTLATKKTRFTDSQNRVFILGVAQDVTEREALIEKLRKSNEELDEFAYVASHDLKAPLTAITRLASWIEEDCAGAFNPDSVKHFAMLKNRVSRMNKLLSDLLSYSRLGRIEHDFTQLNLRTVVQGCADLVDLPASFQLEVENAEVFFPQLALEIILTNLISNAAKHHHKPTGRIVVSCDLKGCQYFLKVSDDGPGIALAFHQKVFERFQTLKPRDEIEGSGLGLSMVKKVIEQFSGSVEVVSDGQVGTTILVKWQVNNKSNNTLDD